MFENAYLINSLLQMTMHVFQQYEAKAGELKVYVDESRFEPHTSYTVRVRSRPDEVHYKGVWSPWAPAIHWRSGDILSESDWITGKQMHRRNSKDDSRC